jgi:hypothetical protein
MAQRPFAWFVVCLFWTAPTSAMSLKSNVDCPLQARVTVQEVREPASDSGLAKRTVVLAVNEAVKGDAGSELEVQILKHGPLAPEIGKQYFVQLNQGRVCEFEAI